MSNNPKKRPFWAYAGPVVLITIYAFLMSYGLGVEQPCNGIEKSSLWCYLHPLTGVRVFALVLISAGVLYQSFYWFYFSKEKKKDGTPAPDGGDKWIVNAGGMVAIAIGAAIILFV